MSMHMEGPWLSTTGKKKGKKKFRNADSANKARQNAEAWQQLLDKWGVKDEDNRTSRKNLRSESKFNPTVNSRVVVDPRRSTNHIPSLDTGRGIAVKKEVQQYTGSECIGVAVMHKSCLQPIFNKQSAEDVAKMRRG
jgi:hypothetical protein